MSDVVIESYYIIKAKGYAGKKDEYIYDGFDGKTIKLTTDRDKAYRFRYFGLKDMEKKLTSVIKHVHDFRDRGIHNLVIVSEDVIGEIANIKDPKVRLNMLLWDRYATDDAIEYMIEVSRDEDGEPTENYVSLHKFLSHAKALNYKDVMLTATNWHEQTEISQMKLAIYFAGEYSVSRFIMFMDYLNELIREDKK